MLSIADVHPTLDLYAPIARDLEAVATALSTAVQGARPCVRDLISHLEHYQGKRLRPALLLLAAKAVGATTPHHHVLAAVVEMIHTATLVHDDVLDAADLRRHVPTINACWSNTTSILLGDYLFTHAFHLASTVDAQACRVIGEATNRVCEGELQQCMQKGNLDLTEAEYFDIIEGKTAELTSCCCRLGALYAGGDRDHVEHLARFGRWLGMAFQITDDVLDLVGEERTTGKSLGTDVEQQKLTLPLIRLLQHSTSDQYGPVRKILQTAGNHKRESLKTYVEHSGAIDYARSRAREFADRARAELEMLADSQCKTILRSLPDRVLNRSM